MNEIAERVRSLGWPVDPLHLWLMGAWVALKFSLLAGLVFRVVELSWKRLRKQA